VGHKKGVYYLDLDNNLQGGKSKQEGKVSGKARYGCRGDKTATEATSEENIY